MHLVRVETAEGPRSGILADDGAILALVGDPMEGRTDGTVLGRWGQLPALAPCAPSKVIGVGRNYADNLAAKGRDRPAQPFVFMKAPNAVVGPGADIRRPVGVDRLDFEAELAVVIGRPAHRLDASDWTDHVLGYTCGNDVSVRDWQTPDRQWVHAKSSDTLCPLGPWIVTDLGDPADLGIRARVNGQLRQDGRTTDLLFSIGELLAYITATITLQPGDVVLTGTPAGAGPLLAGDAVEVDIQGIGTLFNQVIDH